MLNLEQIETGAECVIIKVHGHGDFRHRIIELGFVRGQIVKVIKNAPMKDPVEYQVMDSRISLRRSEARQVEVMTLNEFNSKNRQILFNGTIKIEGRNDEDIDHSNTINVALVGNPNCGKTTLFNKITGQHEKTGNYAGVTVGQKTGTVYRNGYKINIIDLPGTYSITEYTKEEVYVREYITESHPDVILNIVDATNLERNLFLTTQLIDMNIKSVMSLNMYDELSKTGTTLDYTSLSTMLGFPIIPTVASKGEGIEELLDAVILSFEERANNRHIHINYGTIIENSIQNIERELDLNHDIATKYHTRYLSIKLLETGLNVSEIKHTQTVDNKNDKTVFSASRLEKVIADERRNLEREYKDDTRAIITSAKYGFIKGALIETMKRKRNLRLEASSEIDEILTNRLLGIPILLGFIWLMFQATFTIGAYPAGWIESGVSILGELCSSLIPDGMLHDLIVDGIIAGVGSVIVFLPNIVILFLFMSFMEESGYMARAAFIMDKMMHNIGLHGKSFIPLLMGFGCNVPAIISTRTLVSRKDRIMTMLLIPFMSCSARLPVFILLISIFFVKNQGIILLSLYLVGIIMAIITALILRKTLKVKEEAPFVMELPPYRLPSARTIFTQAWDKVSQYLRKMGTTILAFSIVIWALGYFPLQKNDMPKTEKLEKSYIGQIGHVIEPVIRPLGFDWKMGVSLVSGIGAKEVVVSTFGVLYGGGGHLTNDKMMHSSELKQNILEDKNSNGKNVFSPLIAYSLMVFILLYTPCIAVLIAISKEGGRKWGVISVAVSFAMAWIVSYLITNIGGLL